MQALVHSHTNMHVSPLPPAEVAFETEGAAASPKFVELDYARRYVGVEMYHPSSSRPGGTRLLTPKLKPAGPFRNKHAAFGKFQRTMKPALCPLCTHQICMYVFVLHEIIIKLRLGVGRRTKTLLNQPVVGYRLFNDMFVCLCITPACVCLRASGWLRMPARWQQ